MIISFTARGQTKVCTLQSNNKMVNVEQKLITIHRDQSKVRSLQSNNKLL